MIPYRIKRIWKPDIYQGHYKKQGYFEGWYYKLVDRKEKNILAIIPGVSLGDKENLPHAFIQIINGVNCETKYYKYDYTQFKYSKESFEISIGENYFSTNKVKLNIKERSEVIRGKLYFHNIIPWPVKILSPGIMGWYAFIPFMECYHGVLSLDNSINGALCINATLINFNGGKGYIEKDWGTSFPKEWIWSQSNHFDTEGTSLTCSIATIPWINKNFTGYIVGFYYKDELYKFTTYNGAKLIGIDKSNTNLNIVLENSKNRIEIKINTTNTGTLYSPQKGLMNGRIEEGITSEIHVKLYDFKNNRSIFNGIGRNSGLEIKGSIWNAL